MKKITYRTVLLALMTATMIVPETTWIYPFLKAYGAELKDSEKSGKNVKVVVVKNMKQNINNGFMGIKVNQVWNEGDYKCFRISGEDFKETNEGFKKVMAEYDREYKGLERKDKELERNIAYYNGINSLFNIIIYANLG